MKLFLIAIALLCAAGHAPAQTRTPWTTSRIEGTPERPKPFVQEAILGHLKFSEALELQTVPGTGHLLLVERTGRIFTFNPKSDSEPANEIIDLKKGRPDFDNAFGVVLHPRYRENREIFICYALTPGRKNGTKLSRFKLSSLDPMKVDPHSEEVLLTWLSGEHNGANLQFGPDGYLYASAGDGAPPSPPDQLLTGQDTRDLLSSILRIDVDHRDPPLAYRIPPDNPWFDGAPDKAPGTRPELWAFGLRNPFKMSFDARTGNLWCGDIGWELWEMIFLIKKGGNYGWSAYEASQPIAVDRASPLAPITPPVVAHPHSEAASITGGYVYHGTQYPELEGAYIYGDWVTGKVWALWYDGSKVTRHEEIADTPHNLIAFGQTDDGELYYINWASQTTIHRLRRNPRSATPSTFPRTLGETGLFADVKSLKPAPGVYPFEIVHPMWEDGTKVLGRLIGLRDHTKLATTSYLRFDFRTKGSAMDYSTRWPAGAVLARTISLGDLALTEAERNRPVETQILHFDGEAWNGYSYRWNEAGTDAELVPIEGAERVFQVRPDRQAVSPEPREYRYRFQSRSDCLRCHNTWNYGALAFTAAQLQGLPVAQSHELVSLGLIDADYLEGTRAKLEPRGDDFGAARSVLHANCSHCHRNDGGGAVQLFMNTELLTTQMNAVGVAPSRGGLGLKDARLIDPGDPWNSAICVRMAKSGAGHMPVIGARETDVDGLRAVEDWIARMTGDGAGAAPKPWTTTEWTSQLIDRELATVSGAMRLRRAIDDGNLSEPLRRHAFASAWASTEPTVRDIFERFKPDSLREPTLGTQVDVKALLALHGDADRGSRLLSEQGKLAGCRACHFIKGEGRHFGPDLSRIGATQTPAQILDSILNPSKQMALEFRPLLVEMKDGGSHAGFALKRGATSLMFRIASGETLTLQLSEIASEKNLPVSLMPEGQISGLTPNEAADLIAFLSSLK